MPTTWRERLQAALDDTDLSVAELLRRAQVPPTAWHDIMARGQTPSVERLARIANALGKSLDEIYHGTDTDPLQISITGACYGAGDMWEPLGSQAVRTVPFRMLSDDLVWVTVDTTDYEPEYRRGDVLCGPRTNGRHVDNLIGQDCIIVTKSGDRYVKLLARGTKPGRYTLRSLRRHVADMPDAQVDWAAPIQMILRGAS